ncbi:allatotropins-like [Anopheles aquasalis]|uniref:allatotropins-like n=1 Tax=Anopheles aquasalis TaxID=42839 RepID=UPI00215A5C21|nr:allatotropins-like [Anopheles aquasalis]XP_050091685.1 allatotropins-like [Anopheles aquasalis]
MEIMKMSINRLTLLVFVATAVLCWQASEAGPARQLASLAAARASKIPRSIRAPFRNSEMMTARGFGKRRAPIGVNYGGAAGGGPILHGASRGRTVTDGDLELASGGWIEEKHELGRLIEDMAGLDQSLSSAAAAAAAAAVDPMSLGGEQETTSFPLDWFANEMSTNPVLARSILQRFVDTNRDGLLEAAELLPSTATGGGGASSGGSSGSPGSSLNEVSEMY